MSAAVRVQTRRCSNPVASSRELVETVILRDQQVVAVLTQGDPLRYVLQFSVEELQSMRENLAPVLERQPRVKQTLDALIEYKEQQSQGRERPSRGRSDKRLRQEMVHTSGSRGGA